MMHSRPFHLAQLRQWLHEAGRDIRLGLRALTREPAFAAAIAIILTIGIGATAAMLSVLQGMVLRPLPYPRANELALLRSHRIAQNQFEGSSIANMQDWRREAKSFAAMSAYRRTSVSYAVLTGTDEPMRVREGLVDATFFDVVGVRPLAGRTFSASDFENEEAVVVLSEGVWSERFGRAADVVGRTIAIDGRTHVVIGVMPASFRLPTADTRLWRPLSVTGRWWRQAQAVRDADAFEVIGRLAPGAVMDDAAAELAGIAEGLRQQHESNRGLDVRVLPLVDSVVPWRVRRGIWLAFASVLALLAIVGTNIGGLLTARALRRRREFAIRSALGAARSRLLRQLAAENVSLWCVAAVPGVLLAGILLQLLAAAGLSELPRADEIALTAPVVALAMIGSLLVVVVAGSVPALFASRPDAGVAFGSRGAGPGRLPVQNALVVAQVAGAMALLVTATLLAASFVRAHDEDPGYQAAGLAIVRIDRPVSPRFFLDAKERLTRLPGVAGVGGITDFFVRRTPDQEVTAEGRALRDANGRLPKLVIDSVTPGYFSAMAIDLREGRDFDERDVRPGAAPVVIVTDAMARRLWPGESAIGKRLTGGPRPPQDGRWSTVVGIVSDLRRERLDAAPILSVFMPRLLQNMDLTIRSATRADVLLPAIRQELRSLDPTLPLASLTTAERRLDAQLSSRRFEMQTLVAFAAVSLALAAAGLYAMLAFQVGLRTREIAIRSALGAAEPALVAMFLGGGLRLAGIGITLGAAAAAASAKLLQNVLYQTAALDAVTYLGAAGVILIVAAGAAWWPARRAARVSPTIALTDFAD